MPRGFHLAFYLFRVRASSRLDPKRYGSNTRQRVKILQLAETWMRYISLARKNGIACRAEDKLTFLVPGGNAPGLISRFGIEWTVSLSSPRTITILTPRWQFALFISFRRHGNSCSILLGKVAARPEKWHRMQRCVCNIQHILLPFSFANQYGSSALDSLNIAKSVVLNYSKKTRNTECFTTRLRQSHFLNALLSTFVIMEKVTETWLLLLKKNSCF